MQNIQYLLGKTIKNKQNILYYGTVFLFIYVSILFLGKICLFKSNPLISDTLMIHYNKYGNLLFANTIPIYFMFFIVYIIVNSVWVSYLLTSFIITCISLANYYKVTYRGEFLSINDFKLVNEVRNMVWGGEYDLFIDREIDYIVGYFLVSNAIAIILCICLKKYKSEYFRIVVLGLAIFSGILMIITSFNSQYYDDVPVYDNGTIYNVLDVEASRGLIFSLCNDSRRIMHAENKSVDTVKFSNELSQYENLLITREKRVNIISIMREAYTDFSDFDIEGLCDDNLYKEYHYLRSESYAGKLVTDVFAGGTVDTERDFLTGYNCSNDIYQDVNSYVWYLKSQGYMTEGSHPYYEWFYRRKNINRFLGFDNYRFLENDYELLTDSYFPEDAILFDELYDDYIKSEKKKSGSYFSFNVTVQSHGPYSEDMYETNEIYLKGDYSTKCLCAVNNYLSLCKQSDRELVKLVEKLDRDVDPVVVIIFGDHKPWLGDANCYYKELGINMNQETADGMLNYYSTEYIIWANESAKNILGSTFVGQGETISPCFLMNKVFELCGYAGPAYMRKMNEYKRYVDVVNENGFFMKDGHIIENVSDDFVEDLYDFELYLNKNFLF